jgi:hypothetical protein
MSGQNFNHHSKIFYRPIEAALRWCGLTQFESQILRANECRPFKLGKLFPQWPCLQLCVGRILDAIQCNELPYGQLGIPVPAGTPVDSALMTIRHTDLRYWMSRYFPDHKPTFLFENEGNNQGVSFASFMALQADREALQSRIKNIEIDYNELLSELQSVGLEREELKQFLKSNGMASQRSESTFLHIIGALVDLMLSQSPSGKPHSVFRSQAAIVDALTAHHKNLSGISKRTLDEKFAAAKRSITKR